MSSYQIGIIGYGGFGQFLHHAWQSMPEVKVSAVSDQNPANQPRDDQISFYQNWRDLLTDAEIDLVVVATPPVTHAEIACAALEAGKHVLIEKPLATTIADAERIAEAQRKTGRIAAVDYMLRYNPLIAVLAELSQNKILGELRRVVVENYAQDEVLPPEHWFWNRKISGGILVEHAVHFIDLVHLLSARTPQLIQGSTHRRSTGQEDIVTATILYDNGLIATHYHSFTRPGFFERTTIRLVFDLGEIELEGWTPLKGHLRALVDEQANDYLQKLPGLRVLESRKIDELADESRPEGWGNTSEEARLQRQQVQCRGITYPVERLIIAEFSLGSPKRQVYAACLRALLTDLIASIADPSHQAKVTLEDGLKSLEIAVQAVETAQRSLQNDAD